MSSLLTIGELAAHAGVSIRTVRHYHQLGLLPEPQRDELGHRRYGADELVALRRIVTLADAGIPLRDVPLVLTAPPSRRDSLLADADRSLRARERELRESRRRLSTLRRDWDGAGLDGLAGFIGDLRDLGLDEPALDRERQAWELTHALYPELTAAWLEQQRDLLADPEYADLYLGALTLRHLSPSDPAVEELARRNVAWTIAHAQDYVAWQETWAGDADAAQRLSEHTSRLYDFPAYRRLQARVMELLVEAGLPTA